MEQLGDAAGRQHDHHEGKEQLSQGPVYKNRARFLYMHKKALEGCVHRQI